MAFNINAHVILNGPKNIKVITRRIQKQLGSVKATVRLDIPKNLTKSISGFNKGLSTLTKNINTLKTTASSANTQLTNLTKHFQSLSSASSTLAKSQASVQSSVNKTGQAVHQAGGQIREFGKDAALAVRRFAAFTLATGVIFGFVRAVQSATKAALDFEREIIKVVQVTGAGVSKISALKSTIDDLSISLGVDANELAELSRIFSQTGQTIDQVRASITAVARSSLAPTFGTMKNTAEGLIAAMAQFNIAADRSEEVLSGLNAVSKKFAVESEDLISVIRRAGGVFSVAAGQFKDPVDSLNELIGIFTAVRSTTRESADTIAVGLRTIFTRIQRGRTIDFLREFNIELIDAKGNFIGLFPAFQELSRGLDSIIRSGDALTLSKITEELGGVRQVGKLIPAITQFNKALAATKIASEAGIQGLGKDVTLALQPLGKQFELLQQRFSNLIRTISESKTFQNLAKIGLSAANAFLKVAEALTPLLPLLTTFAAIKISGAAMQFGAGFAGGLKKGGGVGGAGGALGSVVTGGPGSGKPDAGTAQIVASNSALATTVKGLITAIQGLSTAAVQPLRLTIEGLKMPLEGLKGAATNIVGAIGNLINALNRLAASQMRIPATTTPPARRPMPRRRFARGGYVSGPSHAQGGVPAVLEGGEYVIPKGYAKGGTTKAQEDLWSGFSAASGAVREKRFRWQKDSEEKFRRKGSKTGKPNKFNEEDRLRYSRTNRNIDVNNLYTKEQREKKGSIANKYYRQLKKGPLGGIQRGLAFEKVLADKNIIKELVGGSARLDAISKTGLASEIKSIDEVLSSKELGKKVVGAALTPHTKFKSDRIVADKLTDQRLTRKEDTTDLGSIMVFQDVTKSKDYLKGVRAGRTMKKAAGGSIFAPQGTDTVPAMLTPGEFVINKTSAKKAGYGNLSRINKMNRGGVVSSGRTQYLQSGTGGGGGGDANMMGMVFGIQMAVGALTGFATALASFDTDNLKGSFAALGYAAMSAVGAVLMIKPELLTTIKSFPIVSKNFAMLGGEVERTKALFKNLPKAFKDTSKAVAEQGKQAKAVFNFARGGGMPAQVTGLGGGKIPNPALKMTGGATVGGGQSITKSLKEGSKAFFKGFKGNFFKIVKSTFTGLPGILASLIVGPLVGVIGKSISESAFGKAEKIKGTNIEGRRGVGRVGGGTAGALEGAGAAAGTGVAVAGAVGIAALMIPPLAPFAIAIGAAVTVVKLWNSAVEGARKQAEFLSFVALEESVNKTNDAFKEFTTTMKGGGIEVAGDALEKLNISLTNTARLMDTQFETSFIREGGQVIGSDPFGERSGKLVDAVSGKGRLDITASPEASQKAFEKSTKFLSPDVMKELDNQFNSTIDSMVTKMGEIDPSGVDGLLGAFVTGGDSIDHFHRSLVTAFEAMDDSGVEGIDKLKGEFNEMMELQFKFKLADRIKKEASAMDVEGSANLILAFEHMKAGIDFGSTPDDLSKGMKEMEISIKKIPGVTDASKKQLQAMVVEQRKSLVTGADSIGIQKQLELAAEAANKAFEAFAQGMSTFGSAVQGITKQLNGQIGDLQSQFNQLTTGKVEMGQADTFNPFENIESATTKEIDAGMAQIQGMAGGRETTGLEGMTSLMGGLKALPTAATATVRELEKTKGAKGKVSEAEIFEELTKQLKKEGIVLPPAALKQLGDQIKSGVLQGSRQGGSALPMEGLKKLLGEEGDIQGKLAKMGETGQKAMATVLNGAKAWENAVRKVGSLQQQMIEKQTQMTLAYLDKTASLTDRLTKLSGGETGTIGQAETRQRSRLETLAGRGTNIKKVGGQLITSKVKGVEDPTNVGQLAAQRKELLVEKQRLDDKMNRQAESPDAAGGAMEETSAKLGLVNAQLNGNTQALQDLSNNTAKLAAIENKIATLQAKALSAEQGAMTLAEANIALAEGTMTPADYKKNVADPLNAFARMERGEDLSDEEARTLQKTKDDPLLGARYDDMIQQESLATGEDAADIRKRRDRELSTQVMDYGSRVGPAGTQRGIAEGQRIRDENEKKAEGLKEEAGVTVDQMLAAQKALDDAQLAGFKTVYEGAMGVLDQAYKKWQTAFDQLAILLGADIPVTPPPAIPAPDPATAPTSGDPPSRPFRSDELPPSRAPLPPGQRPAGYQAPGERKHEIEGSMGYYQFPGSDEPSELGPAAPGTPLRGGRGGADLAYGQTYAEAQAAGPAETLGGDMTLSEQRTADEKRGRDDSGIINVNRIPELLGLYGGGRDPQPSAYQSAGDESAGMFAPVLASFMNIGDAIVKKIEEAPARSGIGLVRDWQNPPPQRMGSGGYVKGRSHAQGGVLIEAEGGEYMIPKNQVKSFQEGGMVGGDEKYSKDAGGGRGSATKTDVTIGEQIAKAHHEGAIMISASLTENASAVGGQIAVGMTEQMGPVGLAIANSIKENLIGTDINIKAQIGPIQVQLTDGGGALAKLTGGVVSTVQKGLSKFFTDLFNSDQSLKGAGTGGNPPISPSDIPQQNKR